MMSPSKRYDVADVQAHHLRGGIAFDLPPHAPDTDMVTMEQHFTVCTGTAPDGVTADLWMDGHRIATSRRTRARALHGPCAEHGGSPCRWALAFEFVDVPNLPWQQVELRYRAHGAPVALEPAC